MHCIVCLISAYQSSCTCTHNKSVKKLFKKKQHNQNYIYTHTTYLPYEIGTLCLVIFILYCQGTITFLMQVIVIPRPILFGKILSFKSRKFIVILSTINRSWLCPLGKTINQNSSLEGHHFKFCVKKKRMRPMFVIKLEGMTMMSQFLNVSIIGQSIAS